VEDSGFEKFAALPQHSAETLRLSVADIFLFSGGCASNDNARQSLALNLE
jgi:hypothetical protein